MEPEHPTRANDPRPPPDAPAERRLAVIMFTDMVGYSALTQRDERLALQLLEEHRRLVRPLLGQHGGREIKTIGDAFLVEFASALAAATCAVEIQRALHEHNRAVPAERGIQLRVGLHVGDVVHQQGDVFGDGVNIAARIEPLAEAGGVCVSEDVARQIQNKVPGIELTKLGAGELKNIAVPVDIYRVRLPWQQRRSALADRLAFLCAKKSVRRALAVAALVAVVGAVWWGRAPTATAPPVSTSRLAVLPLVNLSGDAGDEYFADGMTEELISSLSSIRELSVIARTSIVKFKGTRLDVAEIGRALSVGSILEGTVRMAGEVTRISVRLVDVASQKTLWTQEFTPTIKDVFAVQSAIAVSVTETLKVRLFAGEKDRLDRRGTENSEAYRQYLLGRAQLNKRTGESVMKSIEYFDRSVEADATFALAHAGLAEAYTLVGSAGYGHLPRGEAISQARKHAARAVELDEALAEAHMALAYVKFRIDWDWAGAEAGFKRALQLKPGLARAHESYGLLLAIRKQFPAATAEFQRALQFDPLSPTVSNGLGRLWHFQRRFDEALAQFGRTLELDPQFAEAHFNIGMSQLGLGKYDEAISAMKTALQLSGGRPVIEAMLGMTEGLAGHKDEAQRIYEELRQHAATPYNLAIVSVGLDERDRAFRYFDEAYAERDGVLIFLAVEPVTSAFTDDPRFTALLKKMGLR